MAQTITPVVHGGSRRRWAGAVSLHVLGAAISSAALGALLGAGGSLLGAPWGRAGMFVVALIAVIYAVREVFGLPIPLLEMRRQVPEHWRGSFGPRTVAFLYGVVLGPGFVTHLRHGTFLAASAAALALGDPLLGVALIASFGVARAAGVALTSAARTEPLVMAAGHRLERIGSGSLPRIANALALVGIAVGASLTSTPSGTPVRWLFPALLAGTFGWAAVSKLLRRESWLESVRAHALPARVDRLAESLVPPAEASVALLLLFGQVAAGAGLALGLLAAFSVALLRARRMGAGSLPCGCFGGRARRSTAWLLGRNLGLALLALVALALGAPIPLEAPGPAEALPGVLTLGGIGLAAWLIRRSADLWARQEIGSFGTK
jgi:hypothetical protein